MNWPWRQRTVALPRADRVQIAVLEYELFGIEPPRGGAAEFVIRLRQALGQDSTQRRSDGE